MNQYREVRGRCPATRVGHGCRRLYRAVAWLGAAVFIGLSSGLALAATVPVVEVAKSYTVGIAGASARDSFSVSGPGTLELSLSDLNFLRPDVGLSFQLSDASGKIIGSITGGGVDTFDLTTAGTYFALTYSQADSSPAKSPLPFATYGISLTYLPATPPQVPLPDSALLLLSGLGLLGVFRLRGRRAAVGEGWIGARPLARALAPTAINL